MKRRRDVELVYCGRAEVTAASPAALALEASFGAAPGGRLVRADNAAALATLADELAGRVDLIYVDPPFATEEHWGAFDDRWTDRAAYLAMLEPRLRLLQKLLSDRGSILVHLDWHAGHLVRALLGELFGEENSLGEIIWAYGSPSGGRAAGAKLVKAHDVLYWFAKRRGAHLFHPLRTPYSERYLRDWFRYVDQDGRRYRKRWRDGGRVERQYLDQSPGMPLSTVWSDIQQVYADPRAYKARVRSDVTGYPTQKPAALLDRVVALASKPQSLVVDAFCGSGTTLVAAARAGRRFLGIDRSPRAIQVSTRRLLGAGVGFEVWSDRPPPPRDPPRFRARREGTRVRVELDAETHASADVWSVACGKATLAWCVRERGEVARTLEVEAQHEGAWVVRVADEEGRIGERRLRLR